jgi:hypothetical protein
VTDTNLTLDERQKLERLLAEYANAEMDCVRASGRRHNALHAVLDFVNDRTKQVVSDNAAAVFKLSTDAVVAAFNVQLPVSVPTGTLDPAKMIARNVIGHDHTQPIPQEHCACQVCNETRERQAAPILDVSGGN